MIVQIMDQQMKINQLIEKEPEQFMETVLRNGFVFQLNLREIFFSE